MSTGPHEPGSTPVNDPAAEPPLEPVAADPTTGEPLAGSDPQGLQRIASLAAVAAAASAHAGGWALAQSLRASRRVAGAMTSREKAADLAGDVVSGTREMFDALGEFADSRAEQPGAETAADGGPDRSAPGPMGEQSAHARAEQAQSATVAAQLKGQAILREAGEDLLRRSRDVDEVSSIHPAYERILSELTPDEGRILRLMVLGGPQPSVDVRTGGVFGFFNTHIIKRGLSMVAARAGLRYTDQMPAYLNNLIRLGLVWYSPETIRDYQRYQVLEAQPDVEAAMQSVRRARVVRRSIHLTPFGEDFCRTCFADETVLPGDLPEHSAPKKPVTDATAGRQCDQTPRRPIT